MKRNQSLTYFSYCPAFHTTLIGIARSYIVCVNSHQNRIQAVKIKHISTVQSFHTGKTHWAAINSINTIFSVAALYWQAMCAAYQGANIVDQAV